MRIIITGASGRMGRMLVKAVSLEAGTELVGATERADSEHLGIDAGIMVGIEKQGVALVTTLEDCGEADVLIDFTAPSACLHHAQVVAARGMGMVIGTTGFDAQQQAELDNILQDTRSVVAANYSVGVNLVL